MVSTDRVRELVDSVPFWWHSIDVGGGVVSNGQRSAEQVRRQWEDLKLPELRGKTVLDINTWDGFFAFEAEKHGASSVCALDFYMWAMDLQEHRRHWKECQEKNVIPEPYHEMPYFKPAELPGKRGFDVAHQLRGSNVKSLVADFMNTDLERLGKFDVVLFLGSLYHMENPLESLKRLATVTRELAVIETQAALVPGYEHHSLCEFFESNELNGDVSNWWAPNEMALCGMCRAAGFPRVDVVSGTPSQAVGGGLRHLITGKNGVVRYRAVVHAWK